MGPGAWNEDSGHFPALIDMERPEESPDFFDDIDEVGKQVDEQLESIKGTFK